MNVKSEKYQNHEVFERLHKLTEFYKDLSNSVFAFISTGTSAIFNFESHVFSAVEGTLSSIQIILKEGRINDAFSLLRKYHDSIIIQIYAMLYLEENMDIEHLIVEKIDNWLKSKEELPPIFADEPIHRKV